MKKILFSILLAVLTFSCITKPEDTVSKFINNVKEKKFNEAAKYTLNNEFKGSLNLEYNNKIQQLLFEKLFENMNYTIDGVEKIDKKTTVVNVTVENINTEKIFFIIFSKMFKEAFSTSGKVLSIEEEFQKILESTDIPKEKKVTKFTVTKTKKGNKIEVTPENIDILFGGINTTLSNLDKLGESSSNTIEEKQDTQDKSKEEGPSVGNQQKLTEPKKEENK